MTGYPPDLASLQRIRNLALFDDDQLQQLARNLVVRSAQPGERIISIGDTGNYGLFILEGEAVSLDTTGVSSQVRSEENDYLLPIAQLRPSLYDIEAVSPLLYLTIDDDLLTSFSRSLEDTSGDIEVVTIDEGYQANRLTIRLCQDIANGQVKIPALPDVVFKIQEAFADENTDAARISDLIQSDPAISARLMSLANGPLYRVGEPIETLHQAIVRIGMQAIQQQVVVIAATQLLQGSSRNMKSRMKKLWKDSRRVAAFSRVLAQKSGQFNADTAQMAGLLSDLGVVAILQYIEARPDLYDETISLEDTIRALRPQINGMLLHKWNLGKEIITVGEESHQWFRNTQEQADLCDLVLVARYHSYLGTRKMARLPLLSRVPAFEKLRLVDFGPQDSLQFVRESQEEVVSIEQMLGDI